MHAAIQDSETFNARSVNEESGETQVVEDTGNEGEVTEDTTNIVLYQCSICFDYGHNKRTCPHLGRRESESDEIIIMQEKSQDQEKHQRRLPI